MARIRPRAVGLTVAVSGLAIAAWGAWIGADAGFVLGTVLLAAWLLDVAVLLVADPWRRIGLTRQVAPLPVTAGQPVSVTLIANHNKHPGWLAAGVYDQLPGEAGWAPATSAFQGAPARYTTQLPHRGTASFGPTRLLADSPLGMWQSRRHYQQTTSVVAWPASVPMAVPDIGTLEAQSTTGVGLPRPHLDDTTLRPYQPGDDLHRVHWRSLARTNTLLTRAEEPSAISATTAILWVAGNATPESVELGAGLLASWGQAMVRGGQTFQIVLGENVLRKPSRPQLMDAIALADDASLTQSATNAATSQRRVDAALMVAVSGGSALIIPEVAADGLAVVIGPSDVAVEGPPGWGVWHLDADTSLDDAVAGLQVALAGRQTPRTSRYGGTPENLAATAGRRP